MPFMLKFILTFWKTTMEKLNVIFLMKCVWCQILHGKFKWHKKFYFFLAKIEFFTVNFPTNHWNLLNLGWTTQLQTLLTTALSKCIMLHTYKLDWAENLLLTMGRRICITIVDGMDEWKLSKAEKDFCYLKRWQWQ